MAEDLWIDACAERCAEGCVEGCDVEERGVVDIIELAIKHEGKLRRLLKALKKCCLHSSSSGEES
jgi:hypothetical protein